MNNAKASKVRNFEKGSFNEFLLEGLCNKRENLSSNDFSSKWSQFREFIINVSQSCKEMFLLCKFASKVEYCMRLFDTTLTDEGLCCTFNQVHRKYLVVNYNVNDEWDVEIDEDNYLHPTDWTPETGYMEEIDNFRRFYPRPGSGSGIHMGLTVVLNVNVDDYHCSSTDSKGFKVLLHSPTETPQIQNFGFSITPGYESRVVITPRISNANFKIRSIPQSQRNCIFASEGNLAYFRYSGLFALTEHLNKILSCILRTYSRKNCELECQSNLIFEACGCVLYYMPRTSNETSICNRDDYDCYSTTLRAIEFRRNETFTCHCLPACFELSYGSEISNAHLGTEQFHTKNNFIKAFGKGFVERNLAVMHIYYEYKFLRSSTKEEFIGFTEFLSNTGGLLGLFLGFSVVSLIEIFYFLTFRPYCAQRRQKNVAKITKTARRKRADYLEEATQTQRNRFIGQINGKEMKVFRPAILEPTNKPRKINRYQYFE
ncbi:hypothetical protein HA402_000390 [Bradysia odoriphaga]|nr:hypothetical protein HA402_000390 [Bradysia odoriphaga]